MDEGDHLIDPESIEQRSIDERNHRRRLAPPKATIAALLALLLFVNLSASLYQLPLNRVIERRLCREYYADHDPSAIRSSGDVAEELCKVDEVQRDLAYIQGIMETALVVGDFVTTIPLGFVAEKYGQRAVLWLNLVPRVFMLVWAVVVGYFDAMPTKAIIAGPVLSVLGGNCVFNSITYALAADITDDYVLRATYFGWMSSITYVVALLGPALAGASMSLLLWLPFWIGIFLLLLAIPTISMLSNHPDAHPSRYEDEQTRPLLSTSVLKAQKSDVSIMRSVIGRFQILRSILASHPRNLSFLFVCFFFSSLASSDTRLLAQYISKRYQWTFVSAGYLLSGKAVVNFILLTIVVPSLLRSRYFATRGSDAATSDRANIRFSHVCLIISVCGALAIAISATIWLLFPSLLLYALGSALPVFTLSLLKSPAVAPKQEAGQTDSTDPETHIFSMVMMVKTLGSLVGAPLMALLWMKGIAVGGAALGLPYVISAACYVVADIVFTGIKIS